MHHFKSLSFLIISLLLGCNNDAPQVALPTVFPVDFLTSVKYDQLIVEIGYITGFQPSSTTVDKITAFLTQRLNKPGGITVIQNEIPSKGKTSYSIAEISSVESSSRTQKNTATTITIFMFFADGDYSANLPSLKYFGLTMSNSSLTVFEKTVKVYAGASGQPSVVNLESTVALHELGHMFGLVDNGSPMQSAHQDSAHAAHCDNDTCLMYFNSDTSDGVARVVSSVLTLNPNCLQDLKAAGGL